MESSWQSHIDYVKNKGTPPRGTANSKLGIQPSWEAEAPSYECGPESQLPDLDSQPTLTGWLTTWAGPCICPSLALGFLICKMGQQLYPP